MEWERGFSEKQKIVSKKKSAVNFCQVEKGPTADLNRIKLHF